MGIIKKYPSFEYNKLKKGITLYDKYYLDESGNTGDLINKKFDLNFANQPIFTLSCIKIDDIEKIKKLVLELKVKYKIQGNELKSTSIYKKPEFLLEICQFLTKENIPIFLEVVDKKYNICSTIVNHHVLPPYFEGDESNGETQIIRNIIADYMSLNLPNSYFESFFNACFNQSEESLLNIMNELKDFFYRIDDPEYQVFHQLVEESMDDYQTIKKLESKEQALRKFFPIPDKNKRDSDIILLPHVSSIANILARVNIYNKNIKRKITFIHDKQDHFDNILQATREEMLKLSLLENIPKIITADFNLSKDLKLIFEDSKEYIGIQISDILAGFISRYFKDILYDNKDMDEVYHEIFNTLNSLSMPYQGIGINMVLSESQIKKIGIPFIRNF